MIGRFGVEKEMRQEGYTRMLVQWRHGGQTILVVMDKLTVQENSEREGYRDWIELI